MKLHLYKIFIRINYTQNIYITRNYNYYLLFYCMKDTN